MSHILVTRMGFDDDGAFERYFALMEEWYAPSVRGQSCGDFRLAFIVRKRHEGALKAYWGGDTLCFGSRSLLKEYVVENGVGIQTRHDCDDWMHRDYLKRVRELCDEKASLGRFVVHSRVYKFDVSSGVLYLGVPVGRIDPSRIFVTQFMTLFQSEVDMGVFDMRHRDFCSFENIFMIDGYTMQVVHGGNSYGSITRDDVPCVGSFPVPVA